MNNSEIIGRLKNNVNPNLAKKISNFFSNDHIINLEKYDDDFDNEISENICTLSLELFEYVKNPKELSLLIQAYLLGLIPCNIWMYRPTSLETVPLLQTLREINAFGFITSQGQPGIIDIQLKYMLLQRAYVSGIIHKNLLEKFIHLLPDEFIIMIQHPNMNTKVYFNSKFFPNEDSVINYFKTFNEENPGQTLTTVNGERIIFTMVGDENAHTNDKIYNLMQYTGKYISNDSELDYLTDIYVYKQLNKDYVSVTIIDSDIGRNILLDEILNILQKISKTYWSLT